MSKDRLMYLGIAATLAFSGCGPKEEPLKVIAPVVEPHVVSEIDLYYPELRYLPLYSSGEFKTEKTTTWFNLTPRDFSPSIAKATFDFFEKLANTERVIEYKIGDQSIPFFLDLRPKTKGVFFIIPENAPAPSWGDPEFEKGLTTFIFELSSVSSVRVPSSKDNLPPSRAFTTIETAFNKNFSTEVCQSSVRILSVSPEAAILGQEIICNSYGAAFTIKQMQVTYNDYQSWAKDIQIRRDAQSPYYRLYVLSEKEYNEIPTVGLVIR